MKTIEQETEEKIAQRVADGVRVLPLRDLESQIQSLGYRMVFDFAYVNRLNGHPYWKASAYRIVDQSTGLGFSHPGAGNPNLAQLQAIRLNVSAVNNGRIIQI